MDYLTHQTKKNSCLIYYLAAIITLIGLCDFPIVFPFISSQAKAACDVFENLRYATPLLSPSLEKNKRIIYQ